MRERELEKRFTQKVKESDGVCLKFISPGTRGVPDRLVLFKGGKAGFVEVKRPSSFGIYRPQTPLDHRDLSRLQIYWAERLRELGFPVFVLDNPEDIPTIIEMIKNEV